MSSLVMVVAFLRHLSSLYPLSPSLQMLQRGRGSFRERERRSSIRHDREERLVLLFFPKKEDKHNGHRE